MNKERLKEVLSLATISGNENRVRMYIAKFGLVNGMRVNMDSKGNVYLVKGKLSEGESYPCVVAHMDTVHSSHIKYINEDRDLLINENVNEGKTILTAEMDGDDGMAIQTGIGGDDKAGVAICLELMLKHEKIIGAFFVEEEVGCKGSSVASKDWLCDVGYFMQFDAPTDNWVSKRCMGVELFDGNFHNKIKPILEKYGQTNISSDPYTDVMMLRKLFPVNCINFFSGYYDYHRPTEYVIVEDVEKAINMGDEMITLLGNNKYEFEQK